jgi:leucyl aminopeptidase
MKIEIVSKKPDDVLEIIFVLNKHLEHNSIHDGDSLKKLNFKGEDESCSLLIEQNRLYVGVSDSNDIECFRNSAAVAIRKAKATTYESVSLGCYDKDASLGATYALLEGLLLGAYEFTHYKSKQDPSTLKTIYLTPNNYYQEKFHTIDLENIVNFAMITDESMTITRDLVNSVPEDITPVALAARASRVAKEVGLTCDIFDQNFLAENSMNAFLAVGRASVNPPRLIHLKHLPENPKAKVVLVGKGLTYDSGGLSLKPADSMVTMKMDKAGACAVLGIMNMVARLNLPIEVHGIMGAAENMIGGNAYKPDDILVAKNGKTIEVRNTDAEGRLVLADCLVYASELEPDYLFDMATLTGACVVALGMYTTGVMGHDSRLKHSMVKSANNSGELASTLQFNKYLKKLLKSNIADMSNIGTSRYGGAITAGMFLSEFVDEKIHDKCLHLDIAGPAYNDAPWGVNASGGTGAGVRMVSDFIKNLA